MNYKKNILSLVTIMALGNTAMADATATYLPLTSPTVDSSWVLFGVNGFSTGVPTPAESSGPSSFTSGFSTLQDTIGDDGLSTLGYGGLASLQGLADDAALTIISIGIDISPYIYDATEAMRTMYVKFTDSTPSMKLDYKASMEGATVEVYYNNTTFYHFTITQEGTWVNAVQAIPGLSVESGSGASSKVKAIASVLDYKFSNNPVNPTDYNSSLVAAGGDRDEPAGAGVGAAHFYHYNPIDRQWEVWNRHAVAAANDFTDLSVGQAYWGRMDRVNIDGALAKDNGTGAAGLVLGTAAGTAGEDIYRTTVAEGNTSILTEGWNMLAFDEVQPNVRHSATGLVLTGVAAADRISLTDSTGLYTVTSAVTGVVTAVGMADFSIAFNKQIESLKLRGLLPKTFNIKVFGTGTGGELVIVSDNKFYVDAPVAGTIVVKTLTGGDPYVNGVIAAVGDLEVDATAATTVESVYGEYSIMLEVLTGAGTAAELDSTVADGSGDNLSAKVMFGRAGVDSTTGARGLAANDNASTLGGAKAILDAEPVLNGTNGTVTSVGRTLLVDTSFDGTADMLIAAATEPFYVKDKTYTRVFTFNTAANVAGTDSINVAGSNLAPVTIDPTAATVANVVDLINAQADVLGLTGVYAAAGATTPLTTLVAVTTGNDTFDVKDAPSGTIDFLTAGAESNKIAKGAIGGAYALNILAKKAVVQHTWVYTGFALIDEVGDGVTVDFSAHPAGGAAVSTDVVAPAALAPSVAQSGTITFGGAETTGGDDVLTTTITDAGGTATFTTTVVAGTNATDAGTTVSAVTYNVTGTSSQTYTVGEAAGVVTVTANTAGIPFSEVTVLTTGTPAEITIGAYTPVTANNTGSNTDTAQQLIFMDDIVDTINAQILAEGIHGSASHNFTEAADNYTSAVITITGMDIDADYLVDLDGGGAGGALLPTVVSNPTSATAELITIGSGDLMADVKSNAVYTPNYAVYGPLYTMKNAGVGYDVRALLKATTDMDNVLSPIVWDSIDITRQEDEWFANNEFNLFNIDSETGYWAYLTPKTTPNIVISAPVITPTYTYYFNNSGTTPAYLTNNMINGGSLEVTVTGLGIGDASTVYAIIGAEEIPLKRTASGSDQYTADISTYAMSNFAPAATPIPVTIRAVDGKGASKTESSLVTIDYANPTAVTASLPTATGATFSATGSDVSKIYVFSGYIPETGTASATNLLLSSNTIGGAAAFNLCPTVPFGSTTGLRVVAADGTGVIGTSNISNALNYAYAGTLRGAHVITNTEGGAVATQTIGTLYSDTCSATPATANSGVRLITLVSGMTASISYAPIAGETFDQDVAWASSYQISGNTDIIQIMATAAYVGQDFFVEYNGALYTQEFPTELAAGASVSGNPITLNLVSAANTSLVP